MKITALFGWILLIFLLVGCGEGSIFEDPEAKATRESQGTAFVQTIAVIETQQVTMAALQATAENANLMGTQVAQLSAQNQALQSTLVANSGRATVPVVQSQPIPTIDPNAPLPGQQPAELAGGGQSTGGTTNFQQSGGGQTTTGGTTYIDAVTSTGVQDEDGCAVDSLAQFDASEDEIYMVTTAVNVQPGIAYNTQWSYNGTIFFESDTWTSDATYDEICIWYYITAPFDEGAYSVELLANGQVAARRTFQVGTSAAGGGAVSGTGDTPEAMDMSPTPGQ